MRVLHLITWLVPGGIEKWLLSMLEEIPRDECAMDILCKGPSVGALAPTAEELGARVLHCPLTPGHMRFARGLREILRDGRYDIVHNHLANYSGFATWIARGAGVPVIASYHNTEFPPETWTRLPGLRQLRDVYSRRSMRYALCHSEMVTGCSEAVLQSLTDFAPRRENWKVLPYGVDVAPLATVQDRLALRRELNLPPSTPLILHVGRFIEQKNHAGLLDMFQGISKSVPEARLLLVGKGPLWDKVHSTIAALGLQDRVLCLGTRADVPRLMSCSDLFLFPSLHEGFGLVAIEANAVGLPVVASKIPGVTEAVEEGVTAFLHPLRNTQAMIDSSLRVLRDEELRRAMGEAGRERVCRKFTRAASAQNLVRLYNSIASAREASSRRSGSTLRA